jgi:hypothetical protein
MQFHDNIESEIESLSWEIAERDPRENTFGFFQYGDRAASQGGGVGAFMWFPTEDERQEFLVSCLSIMHSACNSESEFKSQQALLAGALSDSMEDQVPVSYNVAMKGIVKVEWIGAFDDLLASRSSFAQKMRSDFRDECGVTTEAASAISGEEIERFIEFMQIVGI